MEKKNFKMAREKHARLSINGAKFQKHNYFFKF